MRYLLSGALCLFALPCLAAPGEIARAPVTEATGVQPNILFILDDSGSMAWEDTLNQGVEYWGYQPASSVLGDSGVYSISNFGTVSHQSQTSVARAIGSCNGFNVLAYNPALTYAPWAGKDRFGADYLDATLLTARADPYEPTTTVNLTGVYYMPWTDNDGDGEYDFEECGLYRSGNGLYVDTTRQTYINQQSAAQKTNFANWFTYYRDRMSVAKSAMAGVIDTNESRVGLRTIQGRNNRNVADMTDDDERDDLMEELFTAYPSGGTPLRTALKNAGEYFASTGNNAPILSADEGGMCQQNYAIMMTDGYWNGSSPSVGNVDGGSGDYISASHRDSYSNTLGDVAMYYYRTDLRTDLINSVPTVPDVDENPSQHMVTYTVGFGVDGSLTENPSGIDTSFTWPQPVSNTNTTIDDLRHAAWNGRGEYLSAANPQALIDALNNIAQSIAGRAASTGSLDISSGSQTSDAYVIQTTYDPANWAGDVVARKIGSDGTLSSTSEWSVAEWLRDDAGRSSSRKVITYNPGISDVDEKAFFFDIEEAGSLEAEQILDLVGFLDETLLTDAVLISVREAANGVSGTLGNGLGLGLGNGNGLANALGLTGGQSGVLELVGDTVTQLTGQILDTSGTFLTLNGTPLAVRTSELENLIGYLKGDDTYEGTLFRDRDDNYLGDIVHASPAIVGPPSASYRNDMEVSSYRSFKTLHEDRQSMIYIGANDGMLHAIDMESGEEKFAYMPYAAFSIEGGRGIRQLADQNYVHQYYVDATPVARDVHVQLGEEDAPSWHSVLVGGLGAGGKAVYMLDITDPEAFDTLGESNGTSPADIVQWEFTHEDLGYTFSDIQVARLDDGKWYAIFGNGYNADSDGRAKLFIVDLEDPENFALLDSQQGSNAGGSCTSANSDCNGMSSPELADIDADGITDWVYAGDLHGNVWVFDMRDFSLDDVGSGETSRLFQSCAVALNSTTSTCPTASRQPITSRVAVARSGVFNSTVDTPYLNVYWGTGQLLTLQDAIDTSTQSFYSVLHTGDTTRRYHGQLEKQSFTNITGVSDARTVTGVGVDYANQNNNGIQYGWYVELSDSGERLVTIPAVRGDLIVFNTTIPGSNGPCTGGASGWLNALSLRNGLQPVRSNNSVQQVFDYNGDGKVDASDNVNNQVVLSIKTDGEPTSPKFLGDTQYVGQGGTNQVVEMAMDFGIDGLEGRSAWYQLR
ncbi:PilC/PilY family type IV pilus protein [Cobetia marina]|uniref:PilC/PilY family type IV pilus protein n=2 Tax=Halomonadaceae TaxID=28256 RepID=A0ABU9GI16_COBMA